MPETSVAEARRKYGTEKDFQITVIEYAQLMGFHLIYHTYDSRRSSPGMPDLVMVKPPRVLFIEVKSDKGVVGPEQAIWLDNLRQCPGVETYLWRPQNWPEVVTVLTRKDT